LDHYGHLDHTGGAAMLNFRLLLKGTQHQALLKRFKRARQISMKAFFEKYKHRLTVHKLPSYSPGSNPIEKLWKKLKENGAYLHYFPTFESLTQEVRESLMPFISALKEVLAPFGMYYRIDHAA
jgi:transposase